LPVHNSEVAEIFGQVADLLEIEGTNQFRVRSYRQAAETATALSRSLEDMVSEGEDLTELSVIGEDLAGKIEEVVHTGGLRQLEEIEARTPPTLTDMLDVEGLGPKRVRQIHDELGVTTLDELEKAARGEKIRKLEGLGPKIESDILDDLEQAGGEEKRTLLRDAEQVVEPLLDYLRKNEKIEQVVAAGSYRRRKQTVGDLDLMATSDKGQQVIDYFVDYEDVDQVESQGETRSTVTLRTGLQVDLRVVADESFGAALLYLTGSRAHNLNLRQMAVERDLKINEYGVFDRKERIAGETESEIYDIFDLPYIEPELREDRGEIEAGLEGDLPELVTLEDLRGDLHVHTTSSDGHASLEEIVDAARERGYEYLAITDHSEFIGITQGMDADQLAKQIDEIKCLNDDLDDIRILKSVELDILEDGSFALPDDILKRLDLRVCSIHSKFDLAREKQTERVLRAMDSPYFNIFSHPTGRRINERPPYDIDLERVMEAALKRGCYLEVNASPDRLDLGDSACKLAKDMGLKVAISTDTHRIPHLDNMRFGVGQARRGWLSAEDVLNTRGWNDLQKLLERD
jgi:DNA polymerase (family 10)